MVSKSAQEQCRVLSLRLVLERVRGTDGEKRKRRKGDPEEMGYASHEGD